MTLKRRFLKNIQNYVKKCNFDIFCDDYSKILSEKIIFWENFQNNTYLMFFITNLLFFAPKVCE